MLPLAQYSLSFSPTTSPPARTRARPPGHPLQPRPRCTAQLSPPPRSRCTFQACPTRAGRSGATGACEHSLVSFLLLAVRVISRFARPVPTLTSTQRRRALDCPSCRLQEVPCRPAEPRPAYSLESLAPPRSCLRSTCVASSSFAQSRAATRPGRAPR